MSGAGGAERQLSNSRFGFCTSKISSKTGPVAPPRSSPKKVVESSCSVTSQVVESTSSLKEANRNIKGLSSLVKEKNSSSTSFKSKFGFKPGIFNNRNAASKNTETVTKVIESVDSLGRRVDKVSSLVRRGDQSQTRGFFHLGEAGTKEGGSRKESEYISSGDSNDSNLSGSSISSSASDGCSHPKPNLNRLLVDCNSNTPPAQGLRGLPGPSLLPPAKPLRSAERRGLLPPPLNSQAPAVSSPKLRRSAGSPLSSPRSPLSSCRNPVSSPRSPRSPRPKPRLLPKPSCGPSPYRSLATTKAAPLVTSASGDESAPRLKPFASSPATQLSNTSSSNFSLTSSTTPKTRAASISQLPGLRASFFSTEQQPRRLDSASLHSQGLLVPGSKSRLRIPGRPTTGGMVQHGPTVLQPQHHQQHGTPQRPSIGQRVRPSLDDSAPQGSDTDSVSMSSLASISSLPSVTSGKRETGRSRAFVQHKQETQRGSPGQRKWVAKINPAAPRPEKDDSLPSPRSDLDCLAMLKSSNRQAIEVGRGGSRSRLFASRKAALPAITQEDRVEDTLEEEMVVREEKEEALLNKSLSSPTETEDDSGIFTSAHSKYSLESLVEEGGKGSSSKTRLPSHSGPPPKLTRSLPPDFGWSADVRSIRSKPAVIMARSETRTSNLRGFSGSRSVHNFTDSGEEFVSRETSPMHLLDEICQREEEEEEGKGRNRIVPGLVSSRKQLLEAAIKQEKVTRKQSLRSSLGLEEEDEEERESVKAEVVVDRKEESEKRRVRSFVGLRNAACPTGCPNDFSAISGLPQLDRLALQLPTMGKSSTSSSKEASPSLSEVSEASSELTSVSLHLEQLPAPVAPVMSTSTTSSSNLSQVPEGGKKTSSPDQADFLIDDDYNDQQELTFYGHDDSLEESLFEKMDSLLSRRQESQEADGKDEVDGKEEEEGVGEIVDVNVDFSPVHHKPDSDVQPTPPVHLPKIDELKALEGVMVKQRRASVDTLASQASITRDDEEGEDNVDDCMLDFDFEERRDSCKLDKTHPEEKEGKEARERTSLSRSSSSASDEGVILDKCSYEAVREEVGDVRGMLLRLRRVLQEADTVNPFDTDVSLRPGNLYANLVLAESEQLVSAAEAIEKLSAAAAAGQDTLEDFTDPVRDISDSAVRKTVEENQDLRRQVVFLQQTVEERDRRIRALENLLVSDRANSTSGVSSSNSNASMNTATQTEKLRPKSMGSTSNRSTTGDDSQAFISPADPRGPARPPSSSRLSRPLRSPLPLHTARRAESPRLGPRRAESPRVGLPKRPESPRVANKVESAAIRANPTLMSRRAESPRVPPSPPRFSANSRQPWLYSSSTQSGSGSSEASSTEGSIRCCRPSRPPGFPSILPRHRPTIL